MDGKAVCGALSGEFGFLADEGEEERNYLEVV